MIMSTHPLDHIKMKTAPAYMQAELDEHNMKRAAQWENYGKIASQVDAAMAEMDRISDARAAEGWEPDEGGWYTPNGFSDIDWECELGYPLPEHEEWFNWKAQKRIEAGWRMDDSGWYAGDGRHESEFDAEALPEYKMEEVPDYLDL